jgi:hypothetical protein
MRSSVAINCVAKPRRCHWSATASAKLCGPAVGGDGVARFRDHARSSVEINHGGQCDLGHKVDADKAIQHGWREASKRLKEAEIARCPGQAGDERLRYSGVGRADGAHSQFAEAGADGTAEHQAPAFRVEVGGMRGHGCNSFSLQDARRDRLSEVPGC